MVIRETLLGAMVGFVATLIFNAMEFSGTIIGYQMGFAAANVFDPQNMRQTSLMAEFQNIIAVLIFLALDVHHLLIRAMVQSFRLLPPGKENFSGPAIPALLQLSGEIFTLAVQFSAPILVVLLLAGAVLGVMARVFPQLNVFILSYPINFGLGLLLIGVTMTLLVQLLGREFSRLGEQLQTLFQML